MKVINTKHKSLTKLTDMKKTALIIATLLFGISANAQLLWRVNGKDAKGDSYLFGTHHVAPMSVMDSIKGFTPALTSVEEMYGEVEMPENPQSPEMMQLTMKFASAPADSTLTKVLNAAQLDSLNTLLASYTGGMLNAQQFDAFKPSLVTTQIAMMQSAKVFPTFNPMEQLDTQIQQRALAANIPVKGLETMEEQLDILMNAPISDQVEDLMESVRDDSKSAEKAKKLADAYMSENLEAIADVIFGGEDFDPEDPMFKRLFDNRNASWGNKLTTEILPNHKAFVAVGVGHLVGEKGLIKALRNAGYTVTPVE